MSFKYPQFARRIRVPLGFVFAAFYLWLARPAWWSILAGGAIAAAGLGLRAAASGHVKKNEELTTTGPYAYTRNPLYLGSLIMAMGFGAASRNVWVAVAIIVFFLAIYLPVIKSEEEFLAGKFAEFGEYRRNVPRLFPRLRRGDATSGSFSRKLYVQHREYNALLGTALMMIALSLKLVFATAASSGHKSPW